MVLEVSDERLCGWSNKLVRSFCWAATKARLGRASRASRVLVCDSENESPSVTWSTSLRIQWESASSSTPLITVAEAMPISVVVGTPFVLPGRVPLTSQCARDMVHMTLTRANPSESSGTTP